MKSTNNIFEFNYNNRNIKLISVKHNERNISFDLLKKLLNESNTKKVCYLLETDYRKNKIEIRKSFGDYTTKQFMKELLKEEKQNGLKKCVKGWDIRQTILSQNNQNQLYINFYELPFGSLPKFYLKNLEIRKVEKDLEKNIKLFINHNYKESINYYKKNIKIILDLIYLKIKNEKNFMNLKIKNLIKKYPITKNMFNDLSFFLFNAYAVISDLFLLEQIFTKNIISDYIIIMGNFHYNDIINFLKEMKKNNLI